MNDYLDERAKWMKRRFAWDASQKESQEHSQRAAQGVIEAMRDHLLACLKDMLEAAKYIDQEKGVATAADALQGARDIIAEWVSEHEESRSRIRGLFTEKAVMKAKVIAKQEEAAVKYRDYFDWEEPLKTIPSHRFLAIMRGDQEECLSFHILPEEKGALDMLEKQFVKNSGAMSEQVSTAVHDSYKRLLAPSMEHEMRLDAKRKADDEAIRVFAENLRQLLLAPALGRKRIMGIDPG